MADDLTQTAHKHGPMKRRLKNIHPEAQPAEAQQKAASPGSAISWQGILSKPQNPHF